MTILSRRSFLKSTCLSMAPLVVPPLGGPALAHQASQRDAGVNVSIWFEILRVRFQLWHFRDRLLPVLLRSPVMDGDYRYLGFKCPHPTFTAAYQHTVDHLIKSLPTNHDGLSMTSLDHDKTLAPILALSLDARDGREWYQQCESSNSVTGYCRIVQGRCQWDLRSMGPRFPQSMLDEYAEEIAEFIEEPEGASCATVCIRNAKFHQLVKAFTKMPLQTYWNLILPLFYIKPACPSMLLTVRRGNASMYYGGITRDVEHSYPYSTQMSMLSAFVMEHFANDCFWRIQGVAWLRETWGNWHGFMAGQILDVLYQKVIVLRRLCSSRVAPAETDDML
jgi:hypothetical protein